MSVSDIFVTEVFSAIQGEGVHVGRRQVFLRLTGCPHRCAYCDQPEALEKRPGPCLIEQVPGRRDWKEVSSPVPIDEAVEAVDSLWRALPHHSVSITGGEPLMQASRLAALSAQLVDRGHRLHLETAGTLVGGLKKVLPWITTVSMDIKLDSVDGQGIDLAIHRRFLERAIERDVSVKVVVGPNTDVDALVNAAVMCAEVAPDSPFVLQPVTPFATITEPPSPDDMLRWQASCLAVHPDVRVIPQTHKAIGQR